MRNFLNAKTLSEMTCGCNMTLKEGPSVVVLIHFPRKRKVWWWSNSLNTSIPPPARSDLGIAISKNTKLEMLDYYEDRIVSSFQEMIQANNSPKTREPHQKNPTTNSSLNLPPKNGILSLSLQKKPNQDSLKGQQHPQNKTKKRKAKKTKNVALPSFDLGTSGL